MLIVDMSCYFTGLKANHVCNIFSFFFFNPTFIISGKAHVSAMLRGIREHEKVAVVMPFMEHDSFKVSIYFCQYFTFLSLMSFPSD